MRGGTEMLLNGHMQGRGRRPWWILCDWIGEKIWIFIWDAEAVWMDVIGFFGCWWLRGV